MKSIYLIAPFLCLLFVLFMASPAYAPLILWQIEDESTQDIGVEQALFTWTEPNTGMEFVWVPGGCYRMGCGEWTDNCEEDEKPLHKVCLSGFWIGKYEVTIDQYRKFLKETDNKSEKRFEVYWDDRLCPINKDSSYTLAGNKFSQDGEQPMVLVDWQGAQAMAKWLSRKTGKTFRLPTEAEWEYAARSGGKKQKYAGGKDVDLLGWYKGNSDGHTHKVGWFIPNALGIYDMSGNVWEWCQDWYDENAYSRHSRLNPINTNGTRRLVIRGGSWDTNSSALRASHRDWLLSGFTMETVGFRLCIPTAHD